jgi:hypothetical protein
VTGNQLKIFKHRSDHTHHQLIFENSNCAYLVDDVDAVPVLAVDCVDGMCAVGARWVGLAHQRQVWVPARMRYVVVRVLHKLEDTNIRKGVRNRKKERWEIDLCK